MRAYFGCMGDKALLSLDAAADVSGLGADVLYGLIARGQLKGSRDPESGQLFVVRVDLGRLTALLHDEP